MEPLNLGSDESVTINQLVDLVEDIAGIKLKRTYDLSAPKGVNGRNSDNTLIMERLGWAPGISLRDGMEKTYRWIYDEIVAQGCAPRADVAAIAEPSMKALAKQVLPSFVWNGLWRMKTAIASPARVQTFLGSAGYNVARKRRLLLATDVGLGAQIDCRAMESSERPGRGLIRRRIR